MRTIDGVTNAENQEENRTGLQKKRAKKRMVSLKEAEGSTGSDPAETVVRVLLSLSVNGRGLLELRRRWQARKSRDLWSLA
jgi:hypothetical protein